MRFLAIALLCAGPAAQAADAPDSRDFFEKRVRPVFAASCLPCHGTTRMGGLDMASRDALLKGGNLGPAVVPGNPEQSLLIQAVNHQHERLKMPLQQPKLSDARIADLVDWVRASAVWPIDAATPAPKGAKFQITGKVLVVVDRHGAPVFLEDLHALLEEFMAWVKNLTEFVVRVIAMFADDHDGVDGQLIAAASKRL